MSFSFNVIKVADIATYPKNQQKRKTMFDFKKNLNTIQDVLMGIGSTVEVKQLSANEVLVGTSYAMDGALQKSVSAIIDMVIEYTAGYKIDVGVNAHLILPSDCDNDIMNPDNRKKLILAIEKGTLKIDQFGCYLGLSLDESNNVMPLANETSVADHIEEMREQDEIGFNRELIAELADIINNEKEPAFKGLLDKIKKEIIERIEIADR